MSIPKFEKSEKPTLAVSPLLSQTEEPKLEPKKAEDAAAKKNKNYKDSLVIQLPEGEKGKVKAFCALNGISLTDFVYYALEHVMEKARNGEMTVGKYGFTEVRNTEVRKMSIQL